MNHKQVFCVSMMCLMSACLNMLAISPHLASDEIRWNLPQFEHHRSFSGTTIVRGPVAAQNELRWDWSLINTDDISFPKGFKFGVGSSEYQVSGAENCPQANWAQFERQQSFLGTPTIAHGEKSGHACDHWHLYKKDIVLMKELGVDTYRFSIEWSRIEPQEGVFDQEAMQHYSDVVDELLAQGITPMITLYHFTHPQWFEEKHAFERAENIKYFLRFCYHVFDGLGSRVHQWCTINEPGPLVFQSYIRGAFPPRSVLNLQMAGTVTKNLMIAHVEAYRLIKGRPYGNKAHVGIVHNIVQFEPFHEDSLIENNVTYYLNHIFHEAITQFLITKKLNFYVPMLAGVHYELVNLDEQILDFIGLNYYSHALIDSHSIKNDSAYREGDIRTDMPYGFYPEGIYRAIATVSKIGVPIYITENGIADSKDDRRELFLKRYLYAVSRAIKDGYDVRGYIYWSLMDNFEWDMGFEKRFGLYEVDYKTLERTLRPSAEYFKRIVNDTHIRECSLPRVSDHHTAVTINNSWSIMRSVAP